MKSWLDDVRESPVLARVVPFVVFVVLTFGQGQLGDASRYWIYLAKTLLGAWLLWSVRASVFEMKWQFGWEAGAAGILVFACWIGLDGLYPRLGSASAAWNPHERFESGSALAWLFIFVRIAGSTIVVPPLEEVFYRSFLYRCIAKPDFQLVPLEHFAWTPFVATVLIFGFAHHEWLPALLCGMVFQGLVIRKGRLGDAITAHAITNLLLGLWVVWKGDWHFW